VVKKMALETLRNNMETHKQPIVLFGAALLGEVALRTLESVRLQPVCFCDNNPLKQDSRFFGYEVISPATLKRNYANPYVIVCSIQYGGICEQLYGLNIIPHDAGEIFKNVDYHCAYNESEDMVKQEIERYLQIIKISGRSGRVYIENVDLTITEKCSLKCKDCMNLITLYSSPKDVDTALLLRSIRRLSDCVDGIFVVNVHGGEPFMSKDMHIIVDNLIKNPKIMKIMVTTNGTIIPLGKKITCLKHEKIFVVIDNYKGLSKKIPKLAEIFARFNINYKILQMDKWLDYGDLKSRNRNKAELNETFLKCRKCLTVLNSELFICGRSAHGMNLGVFPDIPDDYVDLLNNKLDNIELRKEIYNLLHRTKDLAACNYCNAFNLECARMINSAIQKQ